MTDRPADRGAVRIALEHPDGRFRLQEVRAVLRSIETHGSLSGAARAAGIPYRRAWQVLQDAAGLSGGALIDSDTGGRGGGGSALTDHGRRFLAAVDKACRAMAIQVAALRNVSAPPHESEARVSQPNAAPTLPDPPDVIVATSSEPADCGMLEALEQAFYRERELIVRHITVGSGAALSLLLDGRADMALTHAPQLEQRLADSGSLEALQSVMTSRYVVAFAEGSADGDALEDGTCETVFSRIALDRVPFVSRADQSGTHLRELELWQAIGLRPQRPWYVEAPRAGARGAMRLALQRSAATLVDRLVLDSNDRFRIIEMRCPQADNEFSLVLPHRQTPGRSAARCFAEWLTGASARRIIGDFGATPV